MLSHRGNGAGKLVSGRFWSIERGRAVSGYGRRRASLSSLQPCGFELVAREGMVGGTVVWRRCLEVVVVLVDR